MLIITVLPNDLPVRYADLHVSQLECFLHYPQRTAARSKIKNQEIGKEHECMKMIK